MKRIAFIPLLAGALLAATQRPHIVTYRDAGCGCCEGWVKAARAAGYAVELHDLDRGERLRRFRLSDALAGCHTSLVSGYVVEGHVPLNVVARLLHERPHALPGMPSGVPGMDGPRAGGSDILTLEPHPRIYARA